MDNSNLQVIAYYFAKKGMGDKVELALKKLRDATRTEPENISYAFFRSSEDTDLFVILERYKTVNGLDLHRDTEHFKSIGVEVITPMLDKKEVESFLVPIK